MLAKAKVLAFAALALVACEEKHAAVVVDAGALDAGGPSVDLGGKLGQALASAEEQKPTAPKGGGNGDQPPENGIFTVAAADKALPKNAPAKIDLATDGSDPKQVLTVKPDAASKIVVTVQRAQGGRPQPPMTISFDVRTEKKKDAKDSSPSDGYSVVAKVVDAAAPDAGSKELQTELGKLKGAEVHYTLLPDGHASTPQVSVPKEAAQGLGDIVLSGVDVMAALTPVLPQKPVGVGAQWLVSDRASTFGLDLLRYRLFKIEKIEKDVVTFSLDVRAYIAGDTIDAGRGQKVPLAAFDGQGKGDFLWSGSMLVSAPGELQEQLSFQINAAGPQGQKVPVQQAVVIGKIEPAQSSDKGAKTGK